MAEAKIDANRIAVLQGVSSADNITPTTVTVDPSTKRVQIDFTESALPATSNPIGQIDANRQPVLYGVTDDAAQDVVPIACDSSGNILVDIIIG